MKKILPHVIVFILFIFLAFLGTWQVERRQWKEELLQKVDTNINAPAIPIEGFKNLASDEFRKMHVSGEFIFDKEFLLLNKTHNGKLGQQVFTPFKTTDGQIILVDRGWIPTDKETSKPQGQQEITGVIRGKQALNAIGRVIILENDSLKQIWFWIDLPKMYESNGLAVKDYYLELVNNDKSTSYPIALPQKIELYNEHLQYAITWYSLSIILLLVYYFRFWKTKTNK